jgi:membrane glycosyltransferase
VLSHDFVEAALMRRAGWKVACDRLRRLLGGIAAVLDRHRGARPPLGAGQSAAHEDHRHGGPLSFMSRLHLGIGIMSYLSSPLWLLLLSIGFALALQAH